MHNMLIRPSSEELANFAEPDFTIFNAGRFPANRNTKEMTSKTSVDLHLEQKEFVILGTEYAGEMKKGIFSLMNYLMPKRGVLSMHCSATQGQQGDVSLYFGLSGTGKTTLSADPHRKLIGDDEHGWCEDGIFNIEGGCYAKCIDLSLKSEPEIFRAIQFGTVLENVVFDPASRIVDYTNSSITENTRAAYPIEFIPNALIPCCAGQPKNIIFLTCDAFGVLPPVSRLNAEQAMYYFISGYSAKVAGTEMGVKEPQATFSACFGAAFMVWHPAKYAELLANGIRRNNSDVWLVNTGWTGGPYGTGQRMKLIETRALIDAIHSGKLAKAHREKDPFFGIEVPQECDGVPNEVLIPSKAWPSLKLYEEKARQLVDLFHKNFKNFEAATVREVTEAGPHRSNIS